MRYYGQVQKRARSTEGTTGEKKAQVTNPKPFRNDAKYPKAGVCATAKKKKAG